MIQVAWIPRDVPLLARAVVASGPAAKALGRRLMTLDDDSLRALAAVAGDELLVVLGEALPWVDGVVYLGRDESAPDLLLPTALVPTVPPALLEVAIRRVVPRAAPVAVLPARLVACDTARAIDRALLERWLEAA
jgi:hypothetical protein